MRTCSSSTMVLKDLVRPSRSGSAASASRRVSSSPPAIAPAARETSASGRSERVAAKRPERDAEQRRHHTRPEKGEADDAQRVGEVGEVEHLEVDRPHRGDGDRDDDLGRPFPRSAVGLGGGGAVERLRAQGGRDGRLAGRQRRGVGLGLEVEHRMRCGARVGGVDGREQRAISRVAGLEGAPHQRGVGEGLVLGRRFALGQEEVARREVREPAHEDGEHQRPEAEDGGDAGADAQPHVRAPACSPCPSR